MSGGELFSIKREVGCIAFLGGEPNRFTRTYIGNRFGTKEGSDSSQSKKDVFFMRQ
jgi:hypothetical protein